MILHIWVNYNDLNQRPQPRDDGECKGNYPQIAARFRWMNYRNLPRYMARIGDIDPWYNTGFLGHFMGSTKFFSLIPAGSAALWKELGISRSQVQTMTPGLIRGFTMAWKTPRSVGRKGRRDPRSESFRKISEAVVAIHFWLVVYRCL